MNNRGIDGMVSGPKTLSIMPTYTCTAACSDCGTLSSPRERSRLPLSIIKSAIRQAKQLGFANVVFTGGERLYAGGTCLKACRSHTNSGYRPGL
jgi:MoaA/NifB/PqqE/SkfB family radical SAM enzyme